MTSPQSQQKKGPPPSAPYAPQTQSSGGLPSIIPDVPVSTIFLFMFIVGAACHLGIFKLNNKKGHKFFLSIMLIAFCMCRIITMVLRLAWSTHPHNVRLGLAANIFVQAGTILLYVINLIFAQRIIRAQHTRIGCHRALTLLLHFLIALIILTLILLIISAVQSSYTLNPRIHTIDRIIQIYGTTFYTAVAFLPLPLLVLGLVLPRRIRTEKFGSGRFRHKIVILATASALCTLRAAYGCGLKWLPPTPIQQQAKWQYSKLAFYLFDFVPEVVVVALYAIVRVDRRFHVASGVSRLENAFDWGVYQEKVQMQQDEVLSVYSEEELFDLPGQCLKPSTHGKLYHVWNWPTEITITGGGTKSDLNHLLPVVSNGTNQKFQKCLSRGTVRRKEKPLESRVDHFVAITPSGLSRSSECLSRHSSATLQAAKATSERDKVANEVETDADDDDDVSSMSEVMTASIIREIASLQQIGDTLVQNVNMIQEQPVYLKKGEIAKYSFEMNGLLHVRVPGLHLRLEFDGCSADNTDADGMMTSQMKQAQRRSLQLELEWLSSIPCTEVGPPPIVNLEGEWVEKSTPEGILFSSEGLLLKRKSTLLRLRARCD